MNDYLRLRQICLVARQLHPLEQHLEAILGIQVCHRDPNVAKYGLVNVLFPIGTSFLEIVAPTQENTAAGRFLEHSSGRGGYMAIFDCNDPCARQEQAATLAVRTANVIDHAGYFSVQLHPRDCRATMIEFGHTTNGEDLNGAYWPAGDHWQDTVRNEQAQAVTGIELGSHDPQGLAEHWSRILGLPCVQDGSVFSIDVAGDTLHFRHIASDRERLIALNVSVVDLDRAKSTASGLGYSVEADSFRLGGIDFRLSQG